MMQALKGFLPWFCFGPSSSLPGAEDALLMLHLLTDMTSAH